MLKHSSFKVDVYYLQLCIFLIFIVFYLSIILALKHFSTIIIFYFVNKLKYFAIQNIAIRDCDWLIGQIKRCDWLI